MAESKPKKQSTVERARQKLFMQQPMLHALFQDYRNCAARLSKARKDVSHTMHSHGTKSGEFTAALKAEQLLADELTELLQCSTAAGIPIGGRRKVHVKERMIDHRDRMRKVKLNPIEGWEAWLAAGGESDQQNIASKY